MTISNLINMEESSSNGLTNTVGKGEITRYEQFLLFPVFSKGLYCRHVKTRVCLGKGLTKRLVQIQSICRQQNTCDSNIEICVGQDRNIVSKGKDSDLEKI